jgi:ketosteroid isomerase-like protein
MDDPHAGIRKNIDARVRAVRAKDEDALFAQYAADLRTFDLVVPLENHGDAVRKRVREWFSSFASDIAYAISDVVIEVSGDVAFEHHIVHVQGDAVSGQHVDMRFRETVGYRNIGGAWKVVHQHSSVPVDMKDMKAVLT